MHEESQQDPHHILSSRNSESFQGNGSSFGPLPSESDVSDKENP